MIPEINAKDWKILKATHYKALRIAVCDYKRTISRYILDQPVKEQH